MRRSLSLLSRALPWLLLALGLSPLVVWAYLGTFSRYMADDFATSGELLKAGFWPAQLFWYQSWSGRYSFTFVVALFELAGVWIVAWLPLLSLAAWFLALCWALKRIFMLLGLRRDGVWLAVLSAVIVFGAARSLGDYTQVLFWQTGILTYQSSNTLLCLGLGLFLRRFLHPQARPAWTVWELVLCFALAFLAGGFSETGIVVQVALLTLALVYFSTLYHGPERVAARLSLLAGWLGSCVALVVLVKAPGNLQRNAGLAGLSVPSLAGSFLSSAADVFSFLLGWLRTDSVLAVMLFLAGLLAGGLALRTGDKAQGGLRHGLALLGTAYVLLWAGFFPAFVAWGNRPPERAIFVPLFITVLVVVLLGVLAGRQLGDYLAAGTGRSILQGALLALLVVSMAWLQLRTAIAAAQWTPALRSYAQLWDARDAFLRQAGAQHKGAVVIPSLRRDPALHDLPSTSIWLVGELEETPAFWVNNAAATYYGVKSIAGK